MRPTREKSSITLPVKAASYSDDGKNQREWMSDTTALNTHELTAPGTAQDGAARVPGGTGRAQDITPL